MSHVLLASFSLTAIVARWMAYYHSFFRIFCFFIACTLVGRYFVYSKYFFSIHAPTRGATLWRKNRHGKNNFNPRSHTGSDDILPDTSLTCLYFNPRSHTGSDNTTTRIYPMFVHFNPRSHTGSDQKGDQRWTTLEISIHAPTRGATANGGEMIYDHNDFNPRSHTGSDTCVVIKVVDFKISIHAPTRGATVFAGLAIYNQLFQSTLPHGERRSPITIMMVLWRFQSTLPHGERRSC